MKNLIALFFVMMLNGAFYVNAQTVGTILNSQSSWQGYTLMSPLSDSTTYLIDNCGQVINQWEANYTPGNNAFLDGNGYLYRAGQTSNSYINNGGSGGAIEKFDWNNNLLWSYTLSDSVHRLHHDFELMPNGNILAITWERKDSLTSIQAGRDPSLLSQGEIWVDKIIEIQPIGIDSGVIVWEWSAWDHLVQDFDTTKDNFGNVSLSPRLLNINEGSSAADWMHSNALDYNAHKDIIALSSPEMGEFYFIDHSTTTIEAASSSGGNFGFGGDFLFRWGNPIIYDQGAVNDQRSFYQHDVHWIKEGLPDAGKVMLFNNRLNGATKSAVYIIEPDTTSNGDFDLTAGMFGPSLPFWTYELPFQLTSNILSGAQRLPNGNTLICSGRNGRYIEIDPLDTIVWRYTLPLSANNGIITQGTVDQSQFLFNARRYSEDFPGFTGKDLTPGAKIELNPTNNCTSYENGVYISEKNIFDFELYPNPADHILNINSPSIINGLSVLDIHGNLIERVSDIQKSSISINIEQIHAGIYFVILETNSRNISKLFVKN